MILKISRGLGSCLILVGSNSFPASTYFRTLPLFAQKFWNWPWNFNVKRPAPPFPGSASCLDSSVVGHWCKFQIYALPNQGQLCFEEALFIAKKTTCVIFPLKKHTCAVFLLSLDSRGHFTTLQSNILYGDSVFQVTSLYCSLNWVNCGAVEFTALPPSCQYEAWGGNVDDSYTAGTDRQSYWRCFRAI
jgi:hypothetical protein